MKGVSHWEEELMAAVERNGVPDYPAYTYTVLARREEARWLFPWGG